MIFAQLWAYNSKAYAITVTMAAFNEAEAIGPVIRLIQSLGIVDEIIVIDDLSNDKTASIAQNEGCEVIQNSSRLGQTRSLRRGMTRAKGDIIITMDADMENLPSDIPLLLKYMIDTKSDIVIGKRESNPRLSEKIMSIMLHRFTGIRDTVSGFRVISRSVLVDVEFDNTNTWGTLFYLRCKRKGFRISEYPITTLPRRSAARVGGSFRSNILILLALARCLLYIGRVMK